MAVLVLLHAREGARLQLLHYTTLPPPRGLQETAAASRGIRAVKAREQQLRLEGMTGGKAGKIAASLVTGIKRSKKAKKKGKVGSLPSLRFVCFPSKCFTSYHVQPQERRAKACLLAGCGAALAPPLLRPRAAPWLRRLGGCAATAAATALLCLDLRKAPPGAWCSALRQPRTRLIPSPQPRIHQS